MEKKEVLERVEFIIYHTSLGQLRYEFKLGDSMILDSGTPGYVEGEGFTGEAEWLKKELFYQIAEMDTEEIVRR